MRYSRIIILFMLTFYGTTVFAEDDHTLLSANVQNYIGYGIILLMLLLCVIAMTVTLGSLKVLTRLIFKLEGNSEKPILKEVKAAWIFKKSSGNWFMYFLIPTLGIMGVYLLINYFSGEKQLGGDKYIEASPKKEVVKNAGSAVANRVTEKTVKLDATPAVLDSGKAVFQRSCSACHGDKGQGVVGPNLTDDYWLHGGKIGDVFKTIKDGVPDKGMAAWSTQLSAQNISDVSNFIESLHGTNPPGAKAPQGVKEGTN